ncbi:hypothetical protein ACVOMT_22435 [Sphingomonas panni]
MIAYSSHGRAEPDRDEPAHAAVGGELRALVHIAQRDPARGVLPREAVEQHLRDVLAMQAGRHRDRGGDSLDDARRLRVSYGEAA